MNAIGIQLKTFSHRAFKPLSPLSLPFKLLSPLSPFKLLSRLSLPFKLLSPLSLPFKLLSPLSLPFKLLSPPFPLQTTVPSIPPSNYCPLYPSSSNYCPFYPPPLQATVPPISRLQATVPSIPPRDSGNNSLKGIPFKLLSPLSILFKLLPHISPLELPVLFSLSLVIYLQLYVLSTGNEHIQ